MTELWFYTSDAVANITALYITNWSSDANGSPLICIAHDETWIIRIRPQEIITHTGSYTWRLHMSFLSCRSQWTWKRFRPCVYAWNLHVYVVAFPLIKAINRNTSVIKKMPTEKNKLELILGRTFFSIYEVNTNISVSNYLKMADILISIYSLITQVNRKLSRY